jgi:hypothetical protein
MYSKIKSKNITTKNAIIRDYLCINIEIIQKNIFFLEENDYYQDQILIYSRLQKKFFSHKYFFEVGFIYRYLFLIWF